MPWSWSRRRQLPRCRRRARCYAASAPATSARRLWRHRACHLFQKAQKTRSSGLCPRGRRLCGTLRELSARGSLLVWGPPGEPQQSAGWVLAEAPSRAWRAAMPRSPRRAQVGACLSDTKDVYVATSSSAHSVAEADTKSRLMAAGLCRVLAGLVLTWAPCYPAQTVVF